MANVQSRRQLVAGLSAAALAPHALVGSLRAAARRQAPSDYRLEYRHGLDDLIGDLLQGERGDPRRQSQTPYGEWYSHGVRHRYGAWGPAARRYQPLEGLERRSVEWQRERVIATAARFIGYGYQHHHIPDWDPPAGWPWKETCVGHNGKGFDCSNFTSFVYNQGFGIHMSSAVKRQSELHAAAERGDRLVTLRRVELPGDYQARIETLRAGDLLYIRGREDGPITHVVLWVGELGRSESGLPLVLDSHGAGVDDDHGQPIPCGVHLRPFRDKSWYNRCASHAHRVFGVES